MPRPVTPEDILSIPVLADVQISPDGALVAFVRGEPFKEHNGCFKSQIWVVPTDGGQARPYTSGARADESPRWSPDGAQLAFLSDREGQRNQVYLLDRSGGEARRLTSLQGEISELEWSPDGRRLAFLMTDPEPEEDKQRRERGDDAIEFERRHRWRRVWTVDVASGAAKQITDGEAQVWEFAWRPDGGFVLILGAEPYEWSWFLPRLAVVGPDGGEPQTIYTVPEKQLACPRVSPDNTRVAFLSCVWSDRGMNGGDVIVVALEAGNVGREEGEAVHASPARNLTNGYNGSAWWIQWSDDGAALDYMAYEQGEAAIGRIDLASGRRLTRWRGPAAFGESFSSRYIARDGTIAVLRSDATNPADVWLARQEQPGDPRQQTGDKERERGAEPTRREAQSQETESRNQERSSSVLGLSSSDLQPSLGWSRLTDLHPQVAELALGETRVLYWAGADGQEVQGLLILPVGYQAGQRVPMVTWIHGGPAWLYTQQFYGNGRGVQLFAGAGFAVFLPNPRGSVGWGVPFTEANRGDLGGRDFDDIMAGVDHVIALGIADTQRLGVAGWSYGGFMAAWAITQTDRFRAAMVGAAIINWRSFHGAAHIGAWDRNALAANPYEQGGAYDRFSPIHYVDRVTTPTLLVHGEQDRIVPVDQSYEFFRALKERGVPVELVIYPREGHPINERLHQLDRLKRWLGWFEERLEAEG